MAPSFSKEAILAGDIDYYCLVCDSYMQCEDDVYAHLGKSTHKCRQELYDYVEKYRSDHIRKIKKWYFCEFCSLVLTTLTKVSAHVLEFEHINNRCLQTLRRVGDFVIIFDEIAIRDDAWNGLIENTCTLCCTGYDDINMHKREVGHIIKMIQSKIGFDDDKNIFRKIDECFFHCLTCNNVVAQTSRHFEEDGHRELWQVCCENIDLAEIEEQASSSKEVTENKLSSNSSNKVDKASSNDKLKNQSCELEKNKKNREAKKSEGSEKRVENNESSDHYICDALGAKEYITLNYDHNTWCILCDWCMDAWNVPKHLSSQHHNMMLKMHKQRQERKSGILETSTNETSGENQNSSTILDSLAKFQNNDININFESRKAVCKKCSTSLEFVHDVIDMHIEQHNKTQAQITGPSKSASHSSAVNENGSLKEKETTSLSCFDTTVNDNTPNVLTDTSEPKQEEKNGVQKLIEEHNLNYVATIHKVYCKICDRHIPFSEHNVIEHIKGSLHTTNSNVNVLRSRSKKVHIETVPTCQFINSITVFDNLFKDVVINEKYCVSFFSFALVTVLNGDKLRCQVCAVNIINTQIGDHIDLQKHDKAIRESPVVVQKDSEFIREMRPGKFHCGFCNSISSSWSDMENHLNTPGHKEGKTSAGWRLRQYMPDIDEQRVKRQVHHAFAMDMMLFNNICPNGKSIPLFVLLIVVITVYDLIFYVFQFMTKLLDEKLNFS